MGIIDRYDRPSIRRRCPPASAAVLGEHRHPLAHADAPLVEPGGRFVAGFGAGRGWGFDDFMAMATDAGLEPENVFSTWDLRPFEEDSDFLVAIFYQARSA